MSQSDQNMNSSYESFYAKRTGTRVYPTEFVVRTFLAQYPQLHFDKPNRGDKVLDMAFGDGRNTVFLCDQGYDVHGLEITEGIVNQTQNRLETMGYTADLKRYKIICRVGFVIFHLDLQIMITMVLLKRFSG